MDIQLLLQRGESEIMVVSEAFYKHSGMLMSAIAGDETEVVQVPINSNRRHVEFCVAWYAAADLDDDARTEWTPDDEALLCRCLGVGEDALPTTTQMLELIVDAEFLELEQLLNCLASRVAMAIAHYRPATLRAMSERTDKKLPLDFAGFAGVRPSEWC